MFFKLEAALQSGSNQCENLRISLKDAEQQRDLFKEQLQTTELKVTPKILNDFEYY